jgi:hypothetical protein
MIGVMPDTRGRGTGNEIGSRGSIQAFCAEVVAGEPCALKGARTVRRGVIGNAPIIYSTWLVEGSNPSGPIYNL